MFCVLFRPYLSSQRIAIEVDDSKIRHGVHGAWQRSPHIVKAEVQRREVGEGRDRLSDRPSDLGRRAPRIANNKNNKYYSAKNYCHTILICTNILILITL